MARRTKQEAQETRARLLDAAELLFHERGVSRTSLQDIAQAAGVTRGAVYWHFEDKVQLFNAMMERATMPLEEGFDDALSGYADRPLDELRLRLMNVMHCAVFNARTRRAFEIANLRVEFVGEMASIHGRKVAAHREWTARNQETFERAIALGQLPRDLDTHQAAIGLMALIGGLLHHWIMDPASFDLIEVGQARLEHFLSSLTVTVPNRFAPLTATERLTLGRQPLCDGGRSPFGSDADPPADPPGAEPLASTPTPDPTGDHPPR
ncbi:TetR family transcriptional regulator [Roseateles chitosanitabidus]|uniref:TetR family transcriptional regulator n=1 Tax=Roseateles chitosanitabidus TaxID=65048 RepID=UPI00082D450B|nr:TetR family transcriptional regulator [Roseateles chitosanitabidus]MBO9685868.1 TetR family transcriptional regulator [Roseateles chitosanitabidus]